MDDLLTPNEGVNGEIVAVLRRWRWEERDSREEREVDVKWGEQMRYQHCENCYMEVNCME